MKKGSNIRFVSYNTNKRGKGAMKVASFLSFAKFVAW